VIHQIFHVAALILFLAAGAAAFLGVLGAMIGEEAGIKLPGLRSTLLLALAAAAGLAADWVVHSASR